MRRTARTMTAERASSYHRAPGEAPPPPAGCPVHHTWSPLDDDYLRDPYSIAARLRDDTPVFYAEELGYLVITRMEDIDAGSATPTCTRRPTSRIRCSRSATVRRRCSRRRTSIPIVVMSNRPEPDHGRIRECTPPRLFPAPVEVTRAVRTPSQPRAHRCDARRWPAGGVHRCPRFPLPGETVFRFIGFPEGDDEALKHWCSDRKAFSWGKPSPAEQTEIAEKLLAYWRYCRDFTAAKRDAVTMTSRPSSWTPTMPIPTISRIARSSRSCTGSCSPDMKPSRT